MTQSEYTEETGLARTSCTSMLGVLLCFGYVLAAASQASPAHSQDATTLLHQGISLAAAGKLAEAEEPLVQAAALAPTDTQILTLLAKVKSQLGEINEAIDLFRKVALAEPGSAVAHLNLAIALADSPDQPGALRELDRAILLDAHNALAYLNRARIQADNGRLSAARADYRRAARLDPTNAETYFFWGQLEQADHRSETAASLFAKAVALQSGNARAYFLLGLALQAAHHQNRAIAAWQHAYELNPHYEEAAYALSQALRSTDPAAADKWLETFTQLHAEKQRNDRATELGNKAYAAMQQQLWPSAIETLQQALATCSHCAIEADLHQRLGLAECHAGNLQLGEQELHTALKLKPEDRQTLDALRWIAGQKSAAP